MFGDPGWKPCKPKEHKPVQDTDTDNPGGTICTVCSVILSGPLDDEAKAFGKASGLVAKKPRAPDGKPGGCYQQDPMGNGCPDSWWVGGNYGHPVCKNPLHRFEVVKAALEASTKGGGAP